MRSRLLFLFITLFWLTMNFLLWRAEFSGRPSVGSPVPVETVINKILTAPDASSLEVYHHGKKIGFCRWMANIGEETKSAPDEFAPEGMVGRPTSYSLDLEGNITMANSTNRMRFDLNLTLSTNREWQNFSVRASMRPDAWELHATAPEQKVRLVIDDEFDHWEQSFTFDELRNPQTLLREFGGPVTLAFLGALGNFGFGNIAGTNSSLALPSLKWEANNDSMRFGRSRVRVYRLRTKIMERYEVFIYVSRVGEILWVEFPDKIVLSNDAFTHF